MKVKPKIRNGSVAVRWPGNRARRPGPQRRSRPSAQTWSRPKFIMPEHAGAAGTERRAVLHHDVVSTTSIGSRLGSEHGLHGPRQHPGLGGRGPLFEVDPADVAGGAAGRQDLEDLVVGHALELTGLEQPDRQPRQVHQRVVPPAGSVSDRGENVGVLDAASAVPLRQRHQFRKQLGLLVGLGAARRRSPVAAVTPPSPEPCGRPFRCASNGRVSMLRTSRPDQCRFSALGKLRCAPRPGLLRRALKPHDDPVRTANHRDRPPDRAASPRCRRG